MTEHDDPRPDDDVVPDDAAAPVPEVAAADPEAGVPDETDVPDEPGDEAPAEEAPDEPAESASEATADPGPSTEDEFGPASAEPEEKPEPEDEPQTDDGGEPDDASEPDDAEVADAFGPQASEDVAEEPADDEPAAPDEPVAESTGPEESGPDDAEPSPAEEATSAAEDGPTEETPADLAQDETPTDDAQSEPPVEAGTDEADDQADDQADDEADAPLPAVPVAPLRPRPEDEVDDDGAEDDDLIPPVGPDGTPAAGIALRATPPVAASATEAMEPSDADGLATVVDPADPADPAELVADTAEAEPSAPSPVELPVPEVPPAPANRAAPGSTSRPAPASKPAPAGRPTPTAEEIAYVAALRRKLRWRRRRQTLTFLTLVASVLGVGVLAYGYFEGRWEWPGATERVTACPPPEVEQILPGDVRLRVYNATTRKGLAASVTRDLQKRGFHVLDVGNGESQVPADVAAVLHYGADGEASARAMAAHILGKVQLIEEQQNAGDVVDVFLGPKYSKMRPLAQANKLANPTPTYDPNYCRAPTPSGTEGETGDPTDTAEPSPSAT